MDSKLRFGAPLVGRWTVWWATGADLQQRDFQTEMEAWEAVKWAKMSGLPCCLYDPSGSEVACESWQKRVLQEARSPPVPTFPPPMAGPMGPLRDRRSITPPRRSVSPAVSPKRLSTVSTPTVPPHRGDFPFVTACTSTAVVVPGRCTPVVPPLVV